MSDCLVQWLSSCNSGETSFYCSYWSSENNYPSKFIRNYTKILPFLIYIPDARIKSYQNQKVVNYLKMIIFMSKMIKIQSAIMILAKAIKINKQMAKKWKNRLKIIAILHNYESNAQKVCPIFVSSCNEKNSILCQKRFKFEC